VSRCRLLAWAALLLWLAPGCATSLRGSAPLHLSELSGEGDAARRASMRLIVEGLDSDSGPEASRAQSLYERAVQIDPTNPWAYLAMARHSVDTRPALALDYLDQAEVLLESEPELSPRVEAHLIGLRGAALAATGQERRGRAMLAQAAELAPSVWDDGHLGADELK
jgi:hypothetical protein